MLLSSNLLYGREIEQNAFVPPRDGFDWVQLTSDEWLKGELVSLYEGTLEFDSDHLGVLEIDDLLLPAVHQS